MVYLIVSSGLPAKGFRSPTPPVGETGSVRSMLGFVPRLLPYALAFFSSLCIMTLELVSSRLVAQHVGASLTVWTSVIGIILGGICLGNVLGGRLADRADPRRAVGPLFALGAFLTIFTLWMNAFVGILLPSSLSIPWEMRTVLVVSLVFLIPATVLGMVGPVVAKIAVEQARRAGSAIGDVYFFGAVGSIIGTFFCGFVLIYLAPSSVIVLIIAAALAALAGALMSDLVGLLVGLATATLLLVGSILSMLGNPGMGAVNLGSYQINYVALAGNLVGCVLGLVGIAGLQAARRAAPAPEPKAASPKLAPDDVGTEKPPRPSLADLAFLAFVASLVFMSFEMVAGRLVQRYMGSSIYGWTSVIGVLLAGLSLGNFLGGKIADFVKNERQASWLFLAASVVTLFVIPMDTQPEFLADMLFGGKNESVLQQANEISTLQFGPWPVSLSWPYRILFLVTLVFFCPAVTMGTVSPVVAKLAVDRLKQFRRTGTAIGEVYAWGMVGSIIGTFLTGFVMINFLGTKGVILVLGTMLAFCATFFGPTWHAIWAGIPLGLCALAFTPPWLVDSTIGRFLPIAEGKRFEELGKKMGIREEQADLENQGKYAWIDESNYYFIKIENKQVDNGELTMRTLVLDNLIHGYFVLGHPERLDYDYEHIYAMVAYRAAKASGKLTMAAAGAATPAARETMTPQGALPTSKQEQEPAANKSGEGTKPGSQRNGTKESSQPKAPGGLQSVQAGPDDREKGKQAKEASSRHRAAPDDPEQASDKKIPKPVVRSDDIDKLMPEETPENGSVLPAVEHSGMKTLFLGGGAYCFQRHMQYAYPGTEVDVAEIDPNVTRANFEATGLPRDTTIKTYWGDARQFVELHQDTKKYDLIFGDAFNDFSVPWHLTTLEFNEKLKKMMTPTGVYMINIIDVYESDERANEKAEAEIDKLKPSELTEPRKLKIRADAMAAAYRFGGFVGAWVRTAKKTFSHVYIFGTDEIPGKGSRETFVVVASSQELDLDDLGRRVDDPKFYKDGRMTLCEPYDQANEKAIDLRSRNITLTDDYAPVDNLLAPVAETRGTD
jgi:MFS family permease